VLLYYSHGKINNIKMLAPNLEKNEIIYKRVFATYLFIKPIK